MATPTVPSVSLPTGDMIDGLMQRGVLFVEDRFVICLCVIY